MIMIMLLKKAYCPRVVYFFYLLSPLLIPTEPPQSNIVNTTVPLKKELLQDTEKFIFAPRWEKTDAEACIEQTSKALPYKNQCPTYGADPSHQSSREAYDLIQKQTEQLKSTNPYANPPLKYEMAPTQNGF